MTPDPHEVQTETIRYLLAVNAEKGEEIRRLTAELAAAQAERDRLAADAQRWAMIRDTVTRLDAVARPGLPMGDDDIEQVVLRVLQRAGKRKPQHGWVSHIMGGGIEEKAVGKYGMTVSGGGWLVVRWDKAGDYHVVDSGPETGPEGKAACFAAYLRAAGLA